MNDLNIRQSQFLKQIVEFFNTSFLMKLLGLCLIFSQPMAAADPLEVGLGALERGHYGTALRALRPLANQGDISAQVILGNLYEKGLGIKQDNSTALSWYEKAAEQNSKEGQYNAGLMYFNGSGVEVNREASYQWFSKAAEAGSAGSGIYAGSFIS
jgi:TPR repeat protein